MKHIRFTVAAALFGLAVIAAPLSGFAKSKLLEEDMTSCIKSCEARLTELGDNVEECEKLCRNYFFFKMLDESDCSPPNVVC